MGAVLKITGLILVAWPSKSYQYRTRNTHSEKTKSIETSGRCFTQLAKMSINPKFVELTADALRTIYKLRN